MIHREAGRAGAALTHIEGALAIAHEHDNHMWEGYWLLDLGRAQMALSRPGESLAAFQRSASIHRRIGDRQREAQALDGAGEAYRELGRPLEAIDFHRTAAAMHREVGDRWRLAIALGNLIEAIRRAESGEDVSGYATEGLSALDHLDDPRALALRSRIAGYLRSNG